MPSLFSPSSRRWSSSQNAQQSQMAPAPVAPIDEHVESQRRSTQGTRLSTEDSYEDIGAELPTETTSEHRHQRNVETISRASSIISTGTKMSYRTLPQPGMRDGTQQSTQTHSGPIDIVLGRRNFRITARPGSILSISSFDHPASDTPAPPYEANAPAAESNMTLIQENVGEDQEDSSSTVSDQIDEEPLQPIPRRPRHGVLLSDTQSIHSEHTTSHSRPSTPPSPPLSPATTSANAISAHYTHVVRTIDTNHRAELERLLSAHAIELSQTRNSIDAAYRTEFQQIRYESDARIARLSAQVQDLESLLQTTLNATAAERASTAEERAVDTALLRTEHEREIEQLRADLLADRDEAVRRARNEVEDVWEGRWRDRMRLAGQEINGAWEERTRVAGYWEEEVKRWWPDQVDEIRGNVDLRLRRQRAGERTRSGSGSGAGQH